MPVSLTPVALPYIHPVSHCACLKIIQLQPNAMQKLAILEPNSDNRELQTLDLALRLVSVAKNRSAARDHPAAQN